MVLLLESSILSSYFFADSSAKNAHQPTVAHRDLFEHSGGCLLTGNFLSNESMLHVDLSELPNSSL